MGPLPLLPQKYKAVVLAGAVFVAAVCVSAVFGRRGLSHLQELEGRQRELEAVAFDLQRQNERMREHLDRLAHDDAYLEKLARERLGWVKPGESVYRVRGVVTAAPPVPVDLPSVPIAPRARSAAKRSVASSSPRAAAEGLRR